MNIPVEKIQSQPSRKRHTYRFGMTVGDLQRELKAYRDDREIFLYDEKGNAYPVKRVMLDGRKVVIF